MLTLLPDIAITRRKRVHMVVDESGNLVLAARTIEEAVIWLIDNNHAKVMLQATIRHFYQIDLGSPIANLTGTAPKPVPHPI